MAGKWLADKAGFGEAAARRRDERLAHWREAYPGTPQAASLHTEHRPLTTTDHIFWLLATVFTAGLALPFWIWFAVRGKTVTVPGRG